MCAHVEVLRVRPALIFPCLAAFGVTFGVAMHGLGEIVDHGQWEESFNLGVGSIWASFWGFVLWLSWQHALVVNESEVVLAGAFRTKQISLIPPTQLKWIGQGRVTAIVLSSGTTTLHIPLWRYRMASGKYASEDEVLREALLALAEEEEDLNAIREALAEFQAGDGGVPLDGAFESVRTEHQALQGR